MDEKVTYRELMEKVHAMPRAGKKPHGFYLDLAIDEALELYKQEHGYRVTYYDDSVTDDLTMFAGTLEECEHYAQEHATDDPLTIWDSDCNVVKEVIA